MEKLHFTHTPKDARVKGSQSCNNHSGTPLRSTLGHPDAHEHRGQHRGGVRDPVDPRPFTTATPLSLSRAGALQAHWPALPVPHISPEAWQKAPWKQPPPEVLGAEEESLLPPVSIQEVSSWARAAKRCNGQDVWSGRTSNNC